MDVPPFSDLLTTSLRAAGTSQADLARAVECSAPEMNRYCTGERVPTAATLHRIADALRWDAAWRSLALASVAAHQRAAEAHRA